MLSCTFREYEDSYKANLTAYLKEYEDYTPTSFLEIELNNYTNYYNSLIKISDYFKDNTDKDLRVNSAITDVISDLKKINEPVFNEIFTIGKTITVFDEDEYEGMLILGTIPPSIDINFKKLNNRIASANKIIVFINEQLTISHSPNKNATSIYLTGELPLGTIKQQSVVPGNAIDVNAGANVKPKKSVNPHPQVFLNTEAYELFQKLFEAFKISYNKLADFSFIYRIMHKDGFILDSFKPQMFINWLNKDPFSISLDKLKTLDNCSTLNKIQTYNIIKEALQIK